MTEASTLKPKKTRKKAIQSGKKEISFLIRKTQPDYPCLGLYLNLERSPQRRQALEQQLVHAGLSDYFERFEATDGLKIVGNHPHFGSKELGTFHSHMSAMQSYQNSPVPVHILEDDTLLSKAIKPFIKHCLTTELFKHYDLIFTDVIFHPGLMELRTLYHAISEFFNTNKKAFSLIDLKHMTFSGLNSYVISPKAIAKLAQAFSQHWAQGMPRQVDLFMRDLVHSGQFTAAVVAPFLSAPNVEVEATMANTSNATASTELTVHLLRQVFYIEADLEKLIRTMPKAHPLSESEKSRMDALKDYFGFFISGGFAL